MADLYKDKTLKHEFDEAWKDAFEGKMALKPFGYTSADSLKTCGPYVERKLQELNAFLKKFHHHKPTDRQVQQIAGQGGNARPFEKLAPAFEKNARRRLIAIMALYCMPFVRTWHLHA